MLYKKIPGGGEIPAIGLGTWQVGGGSSPDYSRDAEIIAVWKQALEMGYRHIDTAEMYGGGHTEELLGKAIEGFPRDELLLTSKVWHNHLRQADMLRACEGSLRRLKTDYLDLYLIHWPNKSVPLEETFRGMNALVERGLVRCPGVSNFDLRLLKQAVQLSQTPLAANQAPYSLTNREYAQNGVLDYCQEQGILFTAYTPVEKGRLGANAVLREVAAKHGAAPMQIALAWLVNQPQVITIPMSTNPEHLRENLAAGDVTLDEEDLRRLDAAGA